MSVRFAPSPTGMFHLGNLRTAWVSYVLAKNKKLPWVVRFEDIDKNRSKKEFQENQLDDLKKLQLIPDQIITQSESYKRHFDSFIKALEQDVLYACQCSRKEVVSQISNAPHSPEAMYSGKCRKLSINKNSSEFSDQKLTAWRFKNSDPEGRHDFIVGHTNSINDLSSFIPSYHWACAIDDVVENHSMIVRASDLKTAEKTQSVIHQWVNSSYHPTFFYTALVVTDNHLRLEKRTQGITLQELQKNNYKPEKIIKLFEQSFDVHLLQEKKDPLTLSELGFLIC